MAKVIIYSKTYCPFCDRAKALIESKGHDYEEIMMDDKPDKYRSLMQQTGMRTMPQIFINDQFIGGFQELQALEQRGGLDSLLSSD